MKRDRDSFKDNIRLTFIKFSIVPVAVTVSVALAFFVFFIIRYVSYSSKNENMEISQRLRLIINSGEEIISDVAASLEKNDMEIRSDEIFSALYGRLDEYTDAGDLTIISEGGELLFKSGELIPGYLTEDACSDWGIWYKVKDNKGETSIMLYDGNLIAARGVYKDDELKAAVFYIFPADVIASFIGIRNRIVEITDSYGWVYAGNNLSLKDEMGKLDGDLFNKNGFLRHDGRTYYSVKSNPVYGLYVYTINEISGTLRLFLILVIVIALILIAIVLITLKNTEISSELYTKDIKKIESAFEEASKGNLNVKLNTDSSSEFETIGRDFNLMLQGIKDRISENNELAENAAFSQVKQLESQFNPHFLFNTLDNIRFMTRIDPSLADGMIVSLSRLLRYSIKDMKEEVTVREDLDNLEYYLNILKIRFNKRFIADIDVAEDIYDCLIPKLILQPILENSVKYGFEGREKLSVTIRGYQLKENIVFVCEDDGVGIDEETLRDIRNSLNDPAGNQGHYGLYNVHRRIALMYRGDHGLDISSIKGRGTTVRLTVPRHKEKREGYAEGINV